MITRPQLNAMCRAFTLAATATILNPVIVSNRAASPYFNTGVAPFGVQFHACNSTEVGQTNVFRNCGFVWSYGDTGAGAAQWGIGADPTRSRNFGYGPTGGHVFETPGTYHVTLFMTSSNGVFLSSVSTTIIVQDPAVVYAGAATICVSTSGNFTGAPPASTHTTVTQFTDLQSLLADNVQILGCQGDSFPYAGSGVGIDMGSGLTALKNIRIGSYGSGAAPLVDWIYPGASFASMFNGGNDIKLLDWQGRANGATVTADISGNQLNVTAFTAGHSPIVVGSAVMGPGVTTVPIPTVIALGSGTGGTGTYTLSASLGTITSAVMTTGNGTSRMVSIGPGTNLPMATETNGFSTVLRCMGSRVANFLLPQGTGTCLQDNVCSNLIGTVGNVAVYNINDGQRFFYMAGNDIDRSNTGEHAARFQGVNYATWEQNHFRKAAASKVLLATRGVGAGAAGYGTEISQNYRVTGNFFDLIGEVGVTCCLQIAPQSNFAYEPIQNVIVNHNYFGPSDAVGAVGDLPDILLRASNVTIRHNVSNHSSVVGTNNGQTNVSMVVVNTASPVNSPEADDVLCKNNSSYSSTALRCSYLQGRATATNVVQMYNVVYAPLAPANVPGNFGAGQVVTPNGATIASSNSTVDTGVAGTTWPKNVDPSFTAPTSYTGFTPQVGSYALSDTHSLGFTGFPWGVNYNPTAF